MLNSIVHNVGKTRSGRCRYVLAAAFALLSIPASADDPHETLGRALFFDTTLSASSTQSCATCHDPSRAFIDSRDNAVHGAASTGHEPSLLGDRNTPSIAYAAMTPEFHREDDGGVRGGFFLDGRANTLADQAREPFLNPVEMALDGISGFAERIRRNTTYEKLFVDAFDQDTYANDERLYFAAANALAAFQRGTEFSQFDSRYDRFLAGEIELTMEEELARRLFFSDLVNCMNCHLQERNRIQPREMFTDFRYHNIGLPRHDTLRAANGLGASHTDTGLAARADVDTQTSSGKFRTPSLRNVVVTAPYMHHGLFQHLETAIHFYNRYLVDNQDAETNPETGRPWGQPEVTANIELDLLSQGQPIGKARIQSLIVFLRTLTDSRYEHLLEPAEQTGEHQHE